MEEFPQEHDEIAEIKAAQANPAAFEKLYNRHFKAIYAYVRSSVGNPEIASDIAAEVFYLALKNLAKFKTFDHGLKPWLFTIAVNQIRQHFRRNKRAMQIPIKEDQLVSFTDIEHKLELDDIRRWLSIQLSGLSEVEQELIQLRFIAEFSYKELGQIFGITEDAAKMRMTRLLDKIKRTIPSTKKP